MSRLGNILAVIGLTGLVVGSTGCATKKYVQQNVVDPLEAKIGNVDKKVDIKTAENANRITELDRKTEQGISNAQSSADAAARAAAQAAQTAQAAQQLAQKNSAELGQVKNEVENIDNYQQAKAATLLFGFNRANLTKEDKEQLDQLAQSVASLKHYVIQVRGYTDKVGSPDYNLQLSRRRADAVVRYLTAEAKIPLVRIYMMGYGEDQPVASNSTRKGRKENRRVEVNVLVPPSELAQAGPASSPGAAQQR